LRGCDRLRRLTGPVEDRERLLVDRALDLREGGRASRTTREGDDHHLGETRGVWFKDPDGNILSLIDQSM